MGVRNAHFKGCTFTRQDQGSCGVSFEGGSQNNSISHSEFSDISASAVTIGRTNSYNISEPAGQDADNAVTDCLITNVANEYHGAPGVAVFYARGTSLVHNEISQLPYSGVSIGWGWGRTMEITWPSMPWDGVSLLLGRTAPEFLRSVAAVTRPPSLPTFVSLLPPLGFFPFPPTDARCAGGRAWYVCGATQRTTTSMATTFTT